MRQNPITVTEHFKLTRKFLAKSDLGFVGTNFPMKRKINLMCKNQLIMKFFFLPERAVTRKSKVLGRLGSVLHMTPLAVALEAF